MSELLAAIDEERILQLSNDMSEGIKSGSVKEWRAVAYYFRHHFDCLNQKVQTLKMSLHASRIASEMSKHAGIEIAKWLKENAANRPS